MGAPKIEVNMDKTMLMILQETRKLLEVCYVPWTTDNGNGGRCVLGCVRVASELARCEASMQPLDRSAIRLHPELIGKVAIHHGNMSPYSFDAWPAIYINNQLGKAAILDVVDDAIIQEELRLLCVEVASAAV